MILFGRTIKSKFLPVVLGFLTAVLLLGAFAVSLTYSPEVLAQSTPDQSGRSGFVICGNDSSKPCQIGHLFLALVIIINYLISVVGLVAILFIVIAGVQMTMSRGEEWLLAAKKRLTGAIIGLVLVAVAFILVNSLFSGSLSLGVKDGALILTNPREYINKFDEKREDSNKQQTPAPQTPPGQTPGINPGGR